MAAFFHLRDMPRLRLTAPRHYPSVHDDRFIERAAKVITNDAEIGLKPVINSHSDDGARRQRQRSRKRALRRLFVRRANLGPFRMLVCWRLLRRQTFLLILGFGTRLLRALLLRLSPVVLFRFGLRGSSLLLLQFRVRSLLWTHVVL
jgi:hypothetical protein